MSHLSMTLKGKVLLSLSLGITLACLTTAAVYYFFVDPILACLLGVITGLSISTLLVHLSLKSFSRILGALHLGILNLKDSDYNVQLPGESKDELGKLAKLFNELTDTMRVERKNLYQRELLLETILQQSPSAIILFDEKNQVVFSNKAARRQFWEGKKMEGFHLSEISKYLPEPFRNVWGSSECSLLNVNTEKGTETYQIFRKKFLINMKTNTLLMFHRLTRELSQKEAIIWKKAIRIMNHEINNSLAPISSLIHSAKLLSEKDNGNHKLDRIFQSLENNISNLTQFLESYGKFARLPQPRKEVQQWGPFLSQLHEIIPFQFEVTLGQGWFDPVQMQQVLVNLLKNAKEAGSPVQETRIQVQKLDDQNSLISILDRGKGMSQETMREALLPFFSTKEKGTGLGLPLCKEIIEMHGGSLYLKARNEGGLLVRIVIPNS